jgi:hypothetical protein
MPSVLSAESIEAAERRNTLGSLLAAAFDQPTRRRLRDL